MDETVEDEEKKVDGVADEVNPLGMADDGYENFSFEEASKTAPATEQKTEVTTEAKPVTSETADKKVDASEEEQKAAVIKEDEKTEVETTPVKLASDKKEETADKTDDKKEVETTTDKKEEKETKESKEDTIDYKKEYNKLLAPFKANGKDIKVDNVDDAITLMSMGANYNKKMQALKPHLKVIKMLENNGLLDEGKLSHLIDLDKKNPEAISKLIKDSGINPLDIDVKQASEYKPSTYTVDDKEVELDSVLSDIKDSPKFKDTIDIISTKWDEPSRKVIVDNPGIIKVINEHVELGIYDKIHAVVERERMLGRLVGLSDIQAYKQVGDAINEAGGFAPPAPEKATQTTEVKPTTVVETKPEDTSRNDRRKAASQTTSATSKKVDDTFNPLSMPDEEFDKIASSKYA